MRRRPASVAGVVTAIVLAGGLAARAAAADSDDPRRPAAIQTRDVPLVPPELFARLNQYQNVRTAAFCGWSPDGHGMLIQTRFGNAAQLHRVYTPGGRREQITFLEEPVTGRFLPRAPDGAMVLSSSTGGSENDQLYLLEPQAYRTRLVTDGTSRHQLEAMLRDGSQIVFSSNQRNGRDMDLYVLDPRRPESRRLVFPVDGQTWQAADWSPDGTTLLLLRYVSINEAYPALLEVRTGRRTDLKLPTDEKAAVGPLALAADGKSVYLASDAGGEFRRLAAYELATQQYRWLTGDIPWDVEELAVEPTSGDVALTVNEDGASRLYLLPQGTGARRELKLPLGIVSGLEFSPDGRQLGFTLARPDAPADAYALRLADGHLERWTHSEAGGLDPASFVVPTRVQYPSFDGRLIPAYYYRPRGAAADRKVPVVLNIHGGPESQYQPFFYGFSQICVNELGAAVLHPNVRGSNGYGKTYLKLDNAELREDSVRDIGALLDWIAAQPELDASRVAVVGGSYGGYMVLAALVHFGDRLRAGIDVVGIANFISFLEKTAPYRVDLRRAEYGDERDPGMRAVFERISPLFHAEKIRAALLVVHGKNDPRVPFFEAEQIAAKVRGAGRPVWTVFADNEGHGFAKKDNSDYLRAVQVLFLREHLGPPGTPSK